MAVLDHGISIIKYVFDLVNRATIHSVYVCFPEVCMFFSVLY